MGKHIFYKNYRFLDQNVCFYKLVAVLSKQELVAGVGESSLKQQKMTHVGRKIYI